MTTTIADMTRAVSVNFAVMPTDITGPSRLPPYVRARDAVAWLARRRLHRSCTVIGRQLGGRDHSTVVVAVRRADARRVEDREFRDVTDRLGDAVG